MTSTVLPYTYAVCRSNVLVVVESGHLALIALGQ